MNTKEKNVFQGFKMAVTHSQQCQSKFSTRALLRFSFLFCLFLCVIMAVYLPTAYSYSEVSPHWNHIRTQLTDFRTIYIADDVERASQYDWGASHYDVIMGDGVVRNDTVYEYKRRNPGLKWYAYATNWTFMLINADYVTTAWYIHMQNWYSNHPEYNIEDAFIHDANVCPQGTLKTEACRLQFFLWDSYRFVIYPADPGLQAYQAQRMSDIIAFNTYGGYEPDGVFFDEHASWDIDDARLRNYNIREYTGETNQPGAYMNDLVGLLQIEKNALGPNKLILINSGILRTEYDFQMIMAAGSSFMELMNYPLIDGLSGRWDWVDRILSNGASVTFSFPNYSIPANYTPGNSASGNARFELAALASHYMVVPNQPDNLTYQRDRLFVPFEQLWYTAIETEIGSPLGPRSIYTEGTDPNGWNYRVWARDFGNALVLVRPIAAWNYQTFDDTTGVTITLPSGDTYIPLNSDGTFGAPVSSITLRNAEAAILIKQGSLSPQLQFSSATYDVSEAGTTATITVTRTGSSTEAVSVGYATSNGTATTGSDYTATNGTLTWANGDTTAKTFNISIINDTVVEGSETVNITLLNANGAQISGTNPVVLTISDNDSTGGNGGNNGGGDVSGGSGCGFVKDINGKGQKAKGEGLLIMLIMTLAGIAIVRKAAIYKGDKGVKHIKRMAYLSLFFFVIFCIPVFANAAEYYVATNGSDSNPGTEVLPWKTIQKAADTLVAGDTVLIKEGVYFKDGKGPSTSQSTGGIQIKNSGISGSPITFKAYPGHKPIIDQNYESMGFYIYQKNYITIDGLEIRNAWWAGIRTQSDSNNLQGLIVQNNKIHDIKGPANENPGGIRPDDAVGAIIRNNQIYNISEGSSERNAGGIHSYDFRDSIVENNEIWNVGNAIFYKTQYMTGNITRYNYIHDVTAYGLRFNNTFGGDPCKNHTVHNNIIYKATKAISMYECGDGVVAQNNKFYNNTLVDSPTGFFMAASAGTAIETTQIWNNIIYNTVDGGSQWDTVLMIVDKPSYISLSNYNNFYETTPWLPISWNKSNYTFSGYQSASGLDANSISYDPMFVDKVNQNFRLQSNSPLKGKGLGGVDIGAYATGNEVIGPTDGGTGGGGGSTPPPSSSSGGDTSASGGSGCGFVKDDGKGPKAKGEGLVFAMMLIMTLAGTALLKKGCGYEKRK